jgi:leucyl aminopeptidase
MPNIADIKVEVKTVPPANPDAAVVLVAKWPDNSGPEAVPEPFAAEVTALATADLFTGKTGSVAVHLLPGKEGRRLIVIGLGEAGKVSSETFRVAGGALAKTAKKYRLKNIAVLSAGEPSAVASGFLLGLFNYTDYKGTATNADKAVAAIKLTFVGDGIEASAINRAVMIAEAQNFARTIASRPGNDINPPSLAKVAEQLAKDVGLSVTILDEKTLKQLGMGGILAVGAGSNATPPRMIVLDYSGAKTKSVKTKGGGTPPLLVVGKAITFDTGGISIKQAPGMQKMVFDKCGGMAVLGLMHAAAKLKLPINIVGILAAAENHISETAYRPGDILKMYNGVTVEVTNTDAEGRLVLGDALAWGIETYKPVAVIDLATLTGGVVVALGKTMAGVMSNNDGIVAELEAASKITGEKIWRLPIGDDQRDLLKSEPADIVNSGPREAHPLQGGAFLSYFVPRDGSIPWAHLDIAGVADTEKELPYYAKGATGWGVRTLVEWVTARANGGATNPEANQKTPPPAGG